MAEPTRVAREDLATDAGRLLVRLGLAVLMIALPIASITSRRLVFTLMPVGSVLILIGVFMMPRRRAGASLAGALLSPAGLAAAVLIVWACLSIVWTPFPVPAAERFAKTAASGVLAFLVVLLLPPRSKTSDLNLMPIGAGVASIAAVVLALAAPAGALPVLDVEATTQARAAVGLVLLVWPALGALAVRERWASAGLVAVAVAVAGIAVWTPAALAGMAAGALVFSLATTRQALVSRLMAGVFAALILAAPLVALAATRMSGRPAVGSLALVKSLQGWGQIAAHDWAHLLTGYGFDTFARGISSGFIPGVVPRSLLVELWIETGLIGALAAAGVCIGAFLAAGRTAHAVAPFLLAALTCALTIAIWGLATLQLWWITLIAVMAIGFGCVVKGQSRMERPAVQFVRDAPQPAA